MQTKCAVYSEGFPQLVRPWPYAHTVSLGKKELSEGPLLVLPPRRSALIWRYWNELNHSGELLTKMTNRGKKRKCRDRKESPNSPRA